MTSEGSLERLPSQRRSLALQILSIFWNMLLNVRSLVRLVHLLQVESISELWRYNPRFAIKCLGHNYLAQNLDSRAGVQCFLHHYEKLCKVFPERTLKMILHWDVPLYRVSDDEHAFSLTLGTSKPYDKEGELSLLLKVDDMNLFNLTFTIVPGLLVGSEVPEALLVSRLQGERSYPNEVRLATKAMGNVRPRALLIAALQGVATAMDIGEIDAVGAREQSSFCGHSEFSFQNSYDEFFHELGMERNSAGFFSSRVPIPEKPLELVDPSNRRTARKKQAFKAHVVHACAEAIWRTSGHASEHMETPEFVESEPLSVGAGTDRAQR